ncbi:MAG: hypothetical protein NTZ63_06615, partial [Candidatus Omnitrophica bacterium]|nr:hypothetical protein [Candidatus Omnitrophota bacterium]
RWTSGMSGRTVTLSFTLSDLTQTSVCTVYPTPGSACTTSSGNLTITSMGTTTDSDLYKTYQATYNTSTNKISAYSELASKVL